MRLEYLGRMRFSYFRGNAIGGARECEHLPKGGKISRALTVCAQSAL